MKSLSVGFFFFASNVFVSANPLPAFGAPNDNPFGSPAPDGGLYSPQPPRETKGSFCGVQLVRKPTLLNISYSVGIYSLKNPK